MEECEEGSYEERLDHLRQALERYVAKIEILEERVAVLEYNFRYLASRP